MKILHPVLLVIFTATFLACNSDSDDPSIVSESNSSSATLEIDIPPFDVATASQTTSAILLFNTEDLDTINGQILEVSLTSIVAEIDEFSGPINSTLIGGLLSFRNSSNQQILGVDLTGADFSLDDLDQNNNLLDFSIDDAATVNAFEELFLNQEPLLVEFTALVEGLPAEFEFRVTFNLEVTGELL